MTGASTSRRRAHVCARSPTYPLTLFTRPEPRVPDMPYISIPPFTTLKTQVNDSPLYLLNDTTVFPTTVIKITNLNEDMHGRQNLITTLDWCSDKTLMIEQK